VNPSMLCPIDAPSPGSPEGVSYRPRVFATSPKNYSRSQVMAGPFRVRPPVYPAEVSSQSVPWFTVHETLTKPCPRNSHETPVI
jgi:hypothetical protein